MVLNLLCSLSNSNLEQFQPTVFKSYWKLLKLKAHLPNKEEDNTKKGTKVRKIEKKRQMSASANMIMRGDDNHSNNPIAVAVDAETLVGHKSPRIYALVPLMLIITSSLLRMKF